MRLSDDQKSDIASGILDVIRLLLPNEPIIIRGYEFQSDFDRVRVEIEHYVTSNLEGFNYSAIDDEIYDDNPALESLLSLVESLNGEFNLEICDESVRNLINMHLPSEIRVSLERVIALVKDHTGHETNIVTLSKVSGRGAPESVTTARVSEIAAKLKEAISRKDVAKEYERVVELANKYKENQEYYQAAGLYNYALNLCRVAELDPEVREKRGVPKWRCRLEGVEDKRNKISGLIASLETEFLESIGIELASINPVVSYPESISKHKASLKLVRDKAKEDLSKLQEEHDPYVLMEELDKLTEDAERSREGLESNPRVTADEMGSSIRLSIIRSQESRKEKLRSRIKEEELLRAEGVREIYHDISDGMKGIISSMVEEAIGVLGTPPCEYAIVAFGSMARGEMTPYSDFEWGIILDEGAASGGAGESKVGEDGELEEDDTSTKIRETQERLEGVREYFRKLTYLVQLKVINLGETILPSLAIEELNDFTSSDPLSNWFYDDVTPRGFSMDGLMPGASKWPLGNTHIKGIKQEDKFELIRTGSQIISSYINKETFEQNRSLFFVLTNTVYVHGKREVYDLFIHKRKKKLFPEERVGTPDKLKTSEIALDYLRADVLKFLPKVGKLVEASGDEGVIKRIYPVKFHLYRLPNLVFDGLALHYNLGASNTWRRIEELNQGPQGFLKKDTAERIKCSFSQIAEIRLGRYLEADGQKEDLVAANEQEDEKILKLFEFHFYLVDVGYAFAFNKQNNFNTLLNQHLSRIRVLEELHRYPKVIEECNKLYSSSLTNTIDKLTVLNWLGRGYLSIGDYKSAKKTFEKALKEEEENIKAKNPALMGNYAEVLRELGEYDKTIAALEKALQLTNNEKNQREILYSYGEVNLTSYQIYRQLGMTLVKIGRSKEALEYFEQAKKEAEERFKHGKNIDYYNAVSDLALIHSELGDFKKSESLFDGAKSDFVSLFGNSHPHVASVMYNEGQLLYRQGKYRSALVQYERAVAIYRRQRTQCFIKDEAQCLSDLAVCLIELGGRDNLKRAQTVINDAVEKTESVLGRYHRVMGIVYTNKARVLSGIFYSKFEVLLERNRVLRSQKRLVKPNIIISYDDLKVIMESYERAIEISSKHKHASIDLAQEYNNYASFLLQVRKRSKYINDLPQDIRGKLKDDKLASELTNKGLKCIDEVVEGCGRSQRATECKIALLSTYGNIEPDDKQYHYKHSREQFIRMAFETVVRFKHIHHPHLALAFSGIAAAHPATSHGRRQSIKYFLLAIKVLEDNNDHRSNSQRVEVQRNLAKALRSFELYSLSRDYYSQSLRGDPRVDINDINFYNLVFFGEIRAGDNSLNRKVFDKLQKEVKGEFRRAKQDPAVGRALGQLIKSAGDARGVRVIGNGGRAAATKNGTRLPMPVLAGERAIGQNVQKGQSGRATRSLEIARGRDSADLSEGAGRS